MRTRLFLASLLFAGLVPSMAQALDEKEIMLRAITTIDLCYKTGDEDKIKMLAFGAGIDMTNLTAAEKTVVASTKSLYSKLPTNLKRKVCESAKEALKDFP